MKLQNKEVEDLVFRSYLEEILEKKKFLKMNRYLQHGTTSCLLHSIAVAYYSYRLCKFLKLNVHEKELIRGALLHDYFMIGIKNISHLKNMAFMVGFIPGLLYLMPGRTLI